MCGFTNIFVKFLHKESIHDIKFIKLHHECTITARYGFESEDVIVKNMLCGIGKFTYSADNKKVKVNELATANIQKLYIKCNRPMQNTRIVQEVLQNPHIRKLHIENFVHNTHYTIEDIKDNYSLIKFTSSSDTDNIQNALKIKKIIERNKSLLTNTKSARKI